MTPSLPLLALIVGGQVLHSLLRTSGVQAIAQSSRWRAVALNAASHIVRAVVMTGAVASIMDSSVAGVAAVAVGSMIGDLVSMRQGGKPE